MSVPVLSDPVPQSPGTPQKTITQLVDQWVNLTTDAIAATGHTDGWFHGALLDKKPWAPTDEYVGLIPCSTVGSKAADQVNADVQHVAFEEDPHPIADKLTAYWESQGFAVTRIRDRDVPSGGATVDVRAARSDGVRIDLFASNELVAIEVSSECSTHPSIDDWAEARFQKRFESAFPTPRATPSATPHEGKAGTGQDGTAIDPANPFRQFLEEESATASEGALDHSDLFRAFHEDVSTTAAEAESENDDDGWVW